MWRAHRAEHLLGRIIDDLTDVSRIEAGKLSLHPTRVRLASVAEAAVHSVQDAATTKRIRITVTDTGDGISALPPRQRREVHASRWQGGRDDRDRRPERDAGRAG